MKKLPIVFILVMCFLISNMPGLNQAQGVQQIPGRVAVLEEIVTRSETTYHVKRTEQPPVIDGKADEWANVAAMVLDQEEQGRGIDGPNDLSGSLRLLWDQDALYFCLQVTDNVHHAPDRRAAWDNDGMQFALDAYMNGPGASFNEMVRTYCLSDTVGGPVLSSYSAPAVGEESHDIVSGVTLKTSVRADGVRVFEMAMPWTQLGPIHPWVLGRLPFTFSLNDNDGEGFKGARVWTKGLLWGQDASRFGALIFDDAVGTTDAILALTPELNIFGDRTSSSWMKLKEVDPFTSARLLVNKAKAGRVEATLSVYRPGQANPIATSRIEQSVEAGGTAVFAWDLSQLSNGKYELAFDVPAMPAGPRISWYRMNLNELRARKGELTQRFGLDRPWDDLADAPKLIRRHRGMVAALFRWLEPDSTLAGDALVSALSDTVEMIASLDKGEDYLAGRRNEFWSAYYSSADGSGQHFVTIIPKTTMLPNNIHCCSRSIVLQVYPTGSGCTPDNTLSLRSGATAVKARPEWENMIY